MKRNQHGYGAIEALLILLVIAILGFVGWFVYNKQKESTKTTQSTPSSSTITTPNPTPATNTPSTEWKSYTNKEYGFSYRYPPIWTTSPDTPANYDKAPPTASEFTTGLRVRAGDKQIDTVAVEIHKGTLSENVAVRDEAYAYPPANNKVVKNSSTLKGKQAVSYEVTNNTITSKRYLFAVGDKTYAFTSQHEKFNTENSSDYWTNFQKVFDSFTISK